MSVSFALPPTPTTRPVHLHPALTYLRLADLVCQTLAERNADCAPLAWLSDTLQVPAAELRTTVEYALHLGICQDGPEPVVYCLPPQPIAAGFDVHHHAGRLVLRLPAHGLRLPLLISGNHTGPVPEDERGGTLGAGELAYTIRRLTLMASNWLPAVADPTRLLFELIAEAWRHATTSRLGGGFSVHRASFTQPISTAPVTDRLELVTNRHRGTHRLVNLYPIPARGGGMKSTLRQLRRSVLPVQNRRGTIGTASVIAEGLALTALHVVAPEEPSALRVGAAPGLAVRDVATLPLGDYGGAHRQARLSQQRDRQLVGGRPLDTVDLALLAVPGLDSPPLELRTTPVAVGEQVVVPGYPGGCWSITQGPVTGTDDADFAVQLLLGPGASGAPALDHHGHLVGVVTLDHEAATICVGPQLLATFLRQFGDLVGQGWGSEGFDGAL